MKKILLLLFACLLCTSSALAYDFVLLNTNDWHEQYLGSVYAARDGAQVYTFADLSDIQLKLRTIPSDASIYVIESDTNFVINDFARYLGNLGFDDVESLDTVSYLQLQEQLFSYDQNVLFLSDTFGYEALAVFSLTVNEEYDPYFLNEESLPGAIQIAQSSDDTLLIGHFPLWLRSQIVPFIDEVFVGLEDENVVGVIPKVSQDKEWGLIMSPTNVDLNALQAANPVFVYTGQVDLLAELIDASSITNYEVIGSDLVNTVTSVERNLGYDVRFLVKYARTITGVQGLQGQLLEVDTVLFPYPLSALTLSEALYYEDEGILTVGYTNIGSVDVLFTASVEAGTQIISDSEIYMVRVGDTITIPYAVDSYVEEISVNTQFDRTIPLRKSLSSEDGLPIVNLPVRKESSQLLESPIVKGMSIDSKGMLEASVSNPNDVDMSYVVQVYVNESNELLPLSSKSSILPAGQVTTVVIDAQYVDQIALKEIVVRSVSHYGSGVQWFKQDQETFVEQRTDGPLLFILVIIALLLIVAFAVMIFAKRK